MANPPIATTTASVLVTGGSGFLGSHIVEQFLEDSAFYIATVSRKPKEASNQSRVSYHPADITSKAQIQAVWDQVKPNIVIHTASPHHLDSASTLAETNIEGTKILLKIAKACPETCAFVYTSSASAIVPTQFPLTEDEAELYTEGHFQTEYGMTKAIADSMVQKANSAELHTTVLRLPTIYGERDTDFVPQLVASMRKNEHKMQVGSDSKVFEFVYVKKAAEAHKLAAQALLDPKYVPTVGGEAFFISDGKPQGIFDFSRKCYAAAGMPVAHEDVTVIPLGLMQYMASTSEWVYKILTLGTKKSELRRQNIDHLDRGCCWSIDKAKQRLGYVPIADQGDAIKRTMDWAMENW